MSVPFRTVRSLQIYLNEKLVAVVPEGHFYEVLGIPRKWLKEKNRLFVRSGLLSAEGSRGLFESIDFVSENFVVSQFRVNGHSVFKNQVLFEF